MIVVFTVKKLLLENTLSIRSSSGFHIKSLLLKANIMMTDLIFLFLSSFLAATIFPAQSELVLASLNIADNHDKFLLVAIATTGNVLGALVNWFIGYYLHCFGWNQSCKYYTKTTNVCNLLWIIFCFFLYY